MCKGLSFTRQYYGGREGPFHPLWKWNCEIAAMEVEMCSGSRNLQSKFKEGISIKTGASQSGLELGDDGRAPPAEVAGGLCLFFFQSSETC